MLVLAPRPVLAWLREFRRVDGEATWDAVGRSWGTEEEESDPCLVDVERCVRVRVVVALVVRSAAVIIDL